MAVIYWCQSARQTDNCDLFDRVARGVLSVRHIVVHPRLLPDLLPVAGLHLGRRLLIVVPGVHLARLSLLIDLQKVIFSNQEFEAPYPLRKRDESRLEKVLKCIGGWWSNVSPACPTCPPTPLSLLQALSTRKLVCSKASPKYIRG